MRKTGVPDQSTTGRGYGTAHQNARRDALDVLVDGQPCTRCGRPMLRSDARLLDLDHDRTRTGYLGLAHRSCNRRAGQAVAVAARSRTAKPAPTPQSRVW